MILKGFKMKTPINVSASMTREELQKLTIEIRAQVDSGLMSNKEAHDWMNKITIALLKKELKEGK